MGPVWLKNRKVLWRFSSQDMTAVYLALSELGLLIVWLVYQFVIYLGIFNLRRTGVLEVSGNSLVEIGANQCWFSVPLLWSHQLLMLLLSLLWNCQLSRILSLLCQDGVLFFCYISDLHGAVDGSVGNRINVILGVCLRNTFLKNFCLLDLS